MKKKIEFQGKSKQLSKIERDELTVKLVDAAMKKTFDLIAKDEAKLVTSVCDEFIGPYQKQLSELPEEWTYKVNSTVSIEPKTYGYRDRIYAKPSKEYLDISVTTIPRLNPKNKRHQPFLNHLEKINEKKAKAEEKKAQLAAKTKSALYSANTTRQLFEKWPEAYVEYISAFPPVEKTLPPMIPVADLNRELGL